MGIIFKTNNLIPSPIFFFRNFGFLCQNFGTDKKQETKNNQRSQFFQNTIHKIFNKIYFETLTILYKPAPCKLISIANSPENSPTTFPDHKSVIR